MLLKVGELARRTGLTVRTLHHYDDIGLLQPSGRSDGGYRLYGAADIARLHAIQALRGLGLALDEIGRLLAEGGASLQTIVGRQLQALELQIRQASELRDRLELVSAKFQAGGEPGLDDWLSTLALMTTSAKHFSPEEMKRIFGEWAAVEEDLRRLAGEIPSVMRAGVLPLAPEVQPLARRWMSLMHDWMKGDFALMERWGDMYRSEPGMQGGSGLERDLVDYIEEAVQLRLSVLLRYISKDDLHRLGHVPEREWHALAGDVRASMAEGVPVSSAAARALLARWKSLAGRMSRGDPALLARMQCAHDEEPLLRLGSVVPADVRDYLRKVAAVA
jgi:DNA-binding transcriptional MerR regulator